MKILHTADWHLGKWLGHYSRLEEQQQVLEEICTIANEQEVDAILIAGDIFDTFNPPSEAVNLFYRTVKRLSANGSRPVVAIAGNHDSPDRIENPDPLARECGIILLGYPHSKPESLRLDCGSEILRTDEGFLELKLPKHAPPLRIIATPYANEPRLKKFLGTQNIEDEMRQVLQSHWKNLADKYCDNKGINLLMTHLYVMKEGEEAPPEPEDERPIHIGGAQAVYTHNFPQQVQYVALGHLHRHIQVQKSPFPVVYSSSPLSYSFSEAGQTKYVSIIDAEPGKPVQHEKHALSSGRPLVRKFFDGVENAVQWLKDNPQALVELTIRSNSFLSGKDKKSLQQAHDGIIAIIPDVQLTGENSTAKQIRLDQSTEDLFKDYFRYRHQQQPGEEVLGLFKEIIGSSDKNQ